MSIHSDGFPFEARHTEPAPAAGQERRRSPRQTLIAKALLRGQTETAPVRPVFVSNISMLGVGFHAPTAVPVGERYHLKLDCGPMRWASHVRVVSCTPNAEGTFDVGAELVRNELFASERAALAA